MEQVEGVDSLSDSNSHVDHLTTSEQRGIGNRVGL